MKETVSSKVIVCDCCGQRYHDGNDHCCYVGDTDGDEIEQEALSSGWLRIGGRHYCPDCYVTDENGFVVTEDGRKYNPDTDEEVDLLMETVQNITVVVWPMLYGNENPYDMNTAGVLDLCRDWGREFEKAWRAKSPEEQEAEDYLISLEKYAEEKAKNLLGDNAPAGLAVYNVVEMFVDDANGSTTLNARSFPTLREAEEFIASETVTARSGLFRGKDDGQLCDGHLADNVQPDSVDIWDNRGNRYRAGIDRQVINL